jgi:hypothetical protein
MRRFGLITAVFITIASIISLGFYRAVAQENSQTYLPYVSKAIPPTPTPIPTPSPTPQSDGLVNGSFEEGWTNMPPAPGNLINQKPNGWDYFWIEIGQPLFDSSDVAGGVPESIHKLANQLPPDEQLGGPKALILEGTAVYKIFHFGAPFGGELNQTVENLPPGSVWKLTVPIQVHLHGEPDAYGAESSVWVNGVGGWVNGFAMGDHQWYRHERIFVVPPDGKAFIQVRVKSKWFRSKDFFIDDLQLEQVEGLQLER